MLLDIHSPKFNKYMFKTQHLMSVIFDFITKMKAGNPHKDTVTDSEYNTHVYLIPLNVYEYFPWFSMVHKNLTTHRRVQRGGGSGGPDPPFSWTPPFHL